MDVSRPYTIAPAITFSLPPSDCGKDAWLFLVVEALSRVEIVELCLIEKNIPMRRGGKRKRCEKNRTVS
jgi:hypothetical protein